MTDTTWLDLLAASLGGGLTVKFADILYQEYRHRSEQAQSAKEFVDHHLTPLLKAADELSGKLRAVAETDFRSLPRTPSSPSTLSTSHFSSLLYLFARFFGQIEIIRRKGLSIPLTQDTRGERLQRFFDCLESRRVRILERIGQRAIGESMLRGEPDQLETLSFIDFVNHFESKSDLRRWLSPLSDMLVRTNHAFERQRILQYGVVVHALIDTLDPSHNITRDRPGYLNKLTRRSWRDLKYRVFRLYLPFVSQQDKYIGEPK